MTDPIHVLGFSGSLRRDSLNSALLRGLGELLPEGATLRIAEYRDLPHYDADLDEPQAVRSLREQVAAADAVVIATPEYNYSIPGALKNALDWLSRPAYASVFAGKPVGVLSASPGPIGGARAQAHLKTVLGGMLAETFPHPEIAIGSGHERIQDGRIAAEDTRELLRRYLSGLVGWAASARRDERRRVA